MFPTFALHISPIENMKNQLKTLARLKLSKEKQLYKLRNTERSLSEELLLIISEIDNLTEQLEELKDKLYATNNEITKIEMYECSEKIKVSSRISVLNIHSKQFDEMYNKERSIIELRNVELQQRELEEAEHERQRLQQVDEQNDQQTKTVAALEKESEAIERECAVLKKRNNAIMLKLRRKLVETEDARRNMLKNIETSAHNSERS